MIRFHRPTWLRLPSGPTSRAGSAVMVVLLLAALVSVGAGAGYSVSRPLLGDGTADLPRGTTVVRINGEDGKSVAEVPRPLATGGEPLQTLRLPDGRVAVHNRRTGKTTLIDGPTMTPTRELPGDRSAATAIEPLATDSGGYLVNKKHGTIVGLPAPGHPDPAPLSIPQGIRAAVPGGDSIWVVTKRGEILEVRDGWIVRTVRLGEPAAGLTVADGHPVAVTGSGKAYVVDSEHPYAIGDLGLSGPRVVLGSWRGAGRYVLAVDPATGQVAALNPRTRHKVTRKLEMSADAQLGAPVMLGANIYVPDYAGPNLWRVNIATSAIKRLDVPGHPGQFDLMVSGERVWANSQRDRRAIIVDRNGSSRQVDKGAAPDVGDSEGNPRPGPPSDRSPRPTPPPTNPSGGGLPGPPTPRPGKTAPVPPKQTPSVIGLSREAACDLIRQAKLTCRPQTDPAEVLSPDQLGVVTAQSPEKGTVPPDDKVTITYPDSATMPSVTNMMQGAACAAIKKYKLICRPTPGIAKHPAGMVQDQDPPAGQRVKIGDTTTVTYSSGPKPVRSYLGGMINGTDNPGCVPVTADGFTCQPIEGACVIGTGQQAGTVYAQDPQQGRLDVGQPVKLTYRSKNCPVPNVQGQPRDTACQQLAQAGFICSDQHELASNSGIVKRQEVTGELRPIGTAINIYWSRWQPITYVVYKRNQSNVWVLRPDGDPPAGYGEPRHVVGRAYAPGADIPGRQDILGFFCTAGKSRCRGLGLNHLYTRHTDPKLGSERPDWQGPTQAAAFMDCGLVQSAGAIPIYRVWKDHDGWPTSGRGYREEGITSNPAGWEANEPLGCVWPG